ncbi:MAG: hypothetical protein DRN08_06630 [Thermoplasmata archaeon]|nr:MAG: hypothetical protein DRN08_06630 [Thermoplasmata archaeon]
MGIDVILKYKNILISLMVVVVMLFAANKIYSGYLDSEERLNNREKSIENIEVLAGNLKKMDKQLKDIEAKIFNGDIFDFKRFLERTAEGSGVTVNSFKPHTIKERKSYKKVEVNIDITADYKGLNSLIHAVEDAASATIIKLDRRKNSGHYIIVFYVVIK